VGDDGGDWSPDHVGVDGEIDYLITWAMMGEIDHLITSVMIEGYWSPDHVGVDGEIDYLITSVMMGEIDHLITWVLMGRLVTWSRGWWWGDWSPDHVDQWRNNHKTKYIVGLWETDYLIKYVTWKLPEPVGWWCKRIYQNCYDGDIDYLYLIM
jgi:hypothetical protein